MITLTDRAAEKIKLNILKRGSGIGILVGVRTTGCSGLAYLLEYVDQLTEMMYDYEMYKHNDAIVWVKKKDIPYLDGLQIDYVKKGLNEGFEFINPNEAARCGCGESFTV